MCKSEKNDIKTQKIIKTEKVRVYRLRYRAHTSLSSLHHIYHFLHKMHHNESVTTVLVFVIVGLLLVDKCQSTPLDDYVHAPDSHMNWTIIKTYEQPDHVLYILNFTSQKWFDGKY